MWQKKLISRKTKRRFLLFSGFILIVGSIAVIHGLFTGQISKPPSENKSNNYEIDNNNKTDNYKPDKSKKELSIAEQIGRKLTNNNCSGDEPGKLKRSAMNPDDFNMIIPYGLMVGGHVTPIDHQYYSPADYNSPRDAYPVYAMGDARLILIEHRTDQLQDNDYVRARKSDEYRLVFSQSCVFFYYYDLLTSLTPELENAFKKASYGRRTAQVNIPITAGQLVGRIGSQTLDFAVWDTTKPLDGFVIPEHYQSEPWKRYTADPLDYYTPELKKFMLSRYPRVDNLSGKIDWDIDGTLRGNWFLKGTDYSGDINDRSRYWKTHLSFAPDPYDPSHFVISLGDYQGDAEQFNAKNNRPNPADVNVNTGLVKYELVKDYYVNQNGAIWDQKFFTKGPKLRDSNQVIGTVLVQLTGPQTLMLEIFPGKSANQTSGFTSNAKTYTR